MQHDWMQWIPFSLVKCMPFECSGFHAVWLNAVYSMQHEEMEPYWMRGSLCSMIECSGFLQNNWMQWIFCSMAQSIPIEYSGLHAASMNARIPCIVAQWILIVCSGVHAAKPNASRLNAVRFMQHGPKHPDWMQCTPCSVVKCIRIECNGLHAGWLNAVDVMQHGPKHPDWMQWIPCIVIEFSLLHAAW